MYWSETFLQDLRFAARLLVRSPGFALAAVLCLTIGLGLTTAIYSELRSPGPSRAPSPDSIRSSAARSNWLVGR
jgi:hypothetical protein